MWDVGITGIILQTSKDDLFIHLLLYHTKLKRRIKNAESTNDEKLRWKLELIVYKCIYSTQTAAYTNMSFEPKVYLELSNTNRRENH